MVSGVHLIFLPPYSPDLNPIEVFSKIKAWIQCNNVIFSAATGEGLMYDMQEALNVITKSDAIGYRLFVVLLPYVFVSVHT
jgi:hypothetical protein